MNIQEQLLSNMAGFDVSRVTPVLKTIVGTNPAANTELSDTVPVAKFWKLLSYSVQLAQGATQTPLPNLVITDGTGEIFSAPGASAAVSAATTTQMTWAPGLTLTAGAALTRNYAPLPSYGAFSLGLILPAGYKITSVTTGIGANTDYGAPRIFVVEYS